MNQSQHNTVPMFFGRQPILDTKQELVAYELLLNNNLGNWGAVCPDPIEIREERMLDVLVSLSSEGAFGKCRSFVQLNRHLMFNEVIEALPPTQVALEVPNVLTQDSELIDRCQFLRSRGFSLILDGLGENDPHPALLEMADMVKLDIIEVLPNSLDTKIASLKQRGKRLIAERVETRDKFVVCQDYGFDYFQGYYFATPSLVGGRSLNPAQMRLIRILDLVIKDVDTTVLEAAFKHEPGLMVNLLRLTNSVSSGLSTKVTSLRHALTILGRQQIKRWLQLLVYAGAREGVVPTNPLLPLAATRGRLMEILAEHLEPGNREFSEQSFMVGVISLMPALLGQPIGEILKLLPVSSRVELALCQHGGVQGEMLKLVEATEHASPEALQESIRILPSIKPGILSAALYKAFLWANQIEEG